MDTQYAVSLNMDPWARRSHNRRVALGRHLNSFAGHDGQLSLDETPDHICYGGEEIPTVDVDLYIREDLGHDPHFHGADVFSFRSGRRHIFAAVVVDTVHIDRRYNEVLAADWHVELYWRKAAARKRMNEVLDRISKKCGGLSLRNDGEAA